MLPLADGESVLPLGLTLINEYQARESARFAMLTWPAFSALPARERTMTMAHYTAHRLYEAHTTDAVADENARRNRPQARQ